MPTSLRKACHACTKSKRRCIPQLPACERCQRQNIKCIYDLEPVNDLNATKALPPYSHDPERRVTPPTRIPVVYGSLRDARDAAVAAFEGGASTMNPETHPLMMAGDLVEWILRYFRGVYEGCLRGDPSPYVHFTIVERAQRQPRDMDGTPGESATSRASSAEIGSSNSGQEDMAEVYASLLQIHELIVELLGRITSPRALQQSPNDTASQITHLTTLTHKLYAHDPPPIHSTTPWLTWTTSESIRRTIYLTHALRCTHEALTQGYTTFTPFLEALPLDLGAGLWEATDAQTFTKIKHKYNEAGCETLLSLAEFTEMNMGVLRPEFDGVLQRCLFVSFNGIAGIDFLTRLDRDRGVGAD